MENIVLIDELADCVASAIQKINDGVAAARASGIQAELPAKVDFEMVVVQRWQALNVQNGETGTTTERQGGYSTETQNTTGSDKRNDTDTAVQRGDNSHVQNTTEDVETTRTQS